MAYWVLILAVVTILSYLSDVGILPFLENLRIPFLNASIFSILILLCMIGVLGRMLKKAKKGEKESLKKRILELEKELNTIKEKQE
ncbi:MAG: hypothetical protein E3J56_10130 [Candidatus Aminicenantes bacterium]|nr:MAG: hypothetical protein E3J56_10130 [Candidatus Aminicenantes bacterium]